MGIRYSSVFLPANEWLRARGRSLPPPSCSLPAHTGQPISDFTRLEQTQILSVKAEFLDRISIQDPLDEERKDTEFRPGGSITASELYLHESGDQHKAPLRVAVVRVRRMTVAEALTTYSKDARVSRLSEWPGHLRLRCIELGPERTPTNGSVVLLRPINVYAMRQFDNQGRAQFCLREDVGKWIVRSEGEPAQWLVPNSFAKKRKRRS